MLHTISNALYSRTVQWEGRTILDAQSKLLYSETALSLKPFGIGHTHAHVCAHVHTRINTHACARVHTRINTHAHTTLLRMTDTIASKTAISKVFSLA
jgi:hypothetical protein